MISIINDGIPLVYSGGNPQKFNLITLRHLGKRQ